MTSSEADESRSLSEQIKALAEEVEAGLVRQHYYFVHTKAAWKLVEELAAEGRSSTIDNPFTGTIATLPELASRSDPYIENELIESCFARLVSLLEHWVFGLLRLWLLAHPEGIPEKDKKPVKLADILAAGDKGEILRGVVDWELVGVAYKRPSEWFKYFRGRVNLARPTVDQVEEIAEIKATRDLLIHNRGVVNAAYLEKAGSRARFQPGQRAEVPEPYFHQCWDSILGLVRDMAEQATEKSGR